MEAYLIKNNEQIDGIRKSCRLAAETLRYIEEFVKEGQTTGMLNIKIDEFIRDLGAIPATLNYQGFPASCCTSRNDVVCHGIPSPNEVLKNGDIINIDVSTILDGYYGDTSTMFKVGEIDSENQNLLITTEKCLEGGIQQVRPGGFTGDIGYWIANYASSLNFEVVEEFCGHGTGIAFHEPPHIHHVAAKKSGFEMRPGMIFTIEPILCLGEKYIRMLPDGWSVVTMDGKNSAQYEHTVLVTENGYEILTL